jgi:5-methylcytosine-specific restriction endonuclease McrA
MNKEEQRIYNKNYRKKNLRRLKAQAKAYAKFHKEDKKKYDAEKYQANPEPAKRRASRRRKLNPEEHKKKGAEWYQKNKGRLKAKASAYYEANKEKCIANMRAYSKAHPELDTVKHAKRRARETKSGGEFTREEWLDLCEKHDYRCLRCGKRKPLAADHVIPVSKGGTSNISNIQPLCKICNSIKHTKSTDYRRLMHGKYKSSTERWPGT